MLVFLVVFLAVLPKNKERKDRPWGVCTLSSKLPPPLT